MKDRFGEVIDRICAALGLLGGDSSIQAAIGGWRDCGDDDTTIDQINDWLEAEKARIAKVIADYQKAGYWAPGK